MVLACALGSAVGAQTREKREAVPRPSQSATKPGTKAKAATDSRVRRDVSAAVAALREAAEAARSFDDASSKVWIQAEAADALWPFDEQSARAILRRAWEVTTAPGADDAFATDDPRFDALDYISSARETVITRAAKHDARLAESFMKENARDIAARGDVARQEAGGEDRRYGPHDVWRHPSAEGRQRLLTANALINIGAYESAAGFAAPVIAEGASRPLLDFIRRLRAFDSLRADNLYLLLLERTRLDAFADANDVLLLSTPVVSPDLLISIGEDGSTYFMSIYHHDMPPSVPPPMSQGVRRAFLDTAATVLVRAAAPRAGLADNNAGAMGGYFAIGRLLPFFDREAPQYAPALRARMAALSQGLDDAKRNAASWQMKTRDLNPKNPTDPLHFETEKMKRATSEPERDLWRLEAVSSAADRKLWDRARQLASEINDAETRHAAFVTIAVRQVTNILEAFEDEKADDDFERAATFARTSDVPTAARAVGLAQAAELAARKGQRARSSALFGESVVLASQISDNKELRVTTLLLLTDAAVRFSEQDAWELLPRLVAAVNEAGDNPESDVCGGVVVSDVINSNCISLANDVPEPEAVFAKMAVLDFERALAEARALKDEVTRAEVIIAAARAVLLKKSAGQTAGAL